MTAPLLATRDALLSVLVEHAGCDYTFSDEGVVYECGVAFPTAILAGLSELGREHIAHALSGVVRDPATLADDQALVERLAEDRTPAAPPYGDVRADLRALAAALTEDREEWKP